MLKDPPSNPLSNLINSLLQLSSNSLSLQCLDSVGIGSSRHNDESDNGSFRSSFLESGIESWLLATNGSEADCSAAKRCMIGGCGGYGEGRKGEREVEVDSRARDSINISTPLFLNSYRPAVNK
jgi:hypothetical protein